MSVRRSTSRAIQRSNNVNAIIAPGFGTQADLENLSQALSDGKLSTKAIQAIMNCKGRGIIRKSRANISMSTTSSGWTDHLQTDDAVDDNDDPTNATTNSDNDDSNNNDDNNKASASEKSMMKISSTSSPSLPPQPVVDVEEDADNAFDYDMSTFVGHNRKKPFGSLVQTGTLDATCVGRRNLTKTELEQSPQHLSIPTVLLPQVAITTVIASGHAAHVLCLDTAKNCHGWGRNEQGQLGQPPTTHKNITLPILIRSDVMAAAVGKSHSIFIDSETQQLFAVGSNKCGQCGFKDSVASTNSIKACFVADKQNLEFMKVACGEEFTLALTSGGDFYSTGSSEYGQLGDGETGEYFATASKLEFRNAYGFIERRVRFVLSDSTNAAVDTNVASKGRKSADAKQQSMFSTTPILIQDIACGKHHSMALEAPRRATNSGKFLPPRVFSWGCGDYGCLGHAQQKDEYFPRQITTLPKGIFVSKVAAGSNCSMVLTSSTSSNAYANGHVYYWGKHRSNMEAVMRPMVIEALANNRHIVTTISAGSQNVLCATQNQATVVWGQGNYGELGLGADKKSSARPVFIDNLSGLTVLDAACGQGCTLFVVQDESVPEQDPKKRKTKMSAGSSKISTKQASTPSSLPILDEDAVKAGIELAQTAAAAAASKAGKRKR